MPNFSVCLAWAWRYHVGPGTSVAATASFRCQGSSGSWERYLFCCFSMHQTMGCLCVFDHMFETHWRVMVTSQMVCSCRPSKIVRNLEWLVWEHPTHSFKASPHPGRQKFQARSIVPLEMPSIDSIKTSVYRLYIYMAFNKSIRFYLQYVIDCYSVFLVQYLFKIKILEHLLQYIHVYSVYYSISLKQIFKTTCYCGLEAHLKRSVILEAQVA